MADGGSDGDATFTRLAELTPAAATLGRKLVGVHPDAGEIRIDYEARPEFANRHGTVSGGFLAAMLDSVCAMALVAVLEPDLVPVTTDLTVSYLEPAQVGPLHAVARVTTRVDRDAECEGTLAMPDGTVVATGTARLRVVRRRR